VSLLSDAHQYAKRGWLVVPLHNPRQGVCSCRKQSCGSPGKHPRTEHGLKEGSTDAGQIDNWWRQWPEANVGILTGEASGLIVLDVDGEDGKTSLQALTGVHGALPKTLCAMTGRTGSDGARKGCHYYYRPPAGIQIRNSAGILGKGLDVRGEGGYVVAAPSLHSSGRLYEWLAPVRPVADMPLWMVEKLSEAKPPAEALPIQPGAAISEGGRNAALTSLAGTMRRRGMSQDAIEAALLAENDLRCNPPLPASEIRDIARSVGRYAPSPAPRKAPEAAGEPPQDQIRQWPAPLAEEAFHGLAGEFARLVGPHTEADPAALLFQCLVALGSIVGRGPYYRVGAERHHVNIFAVCVADSSKGRKGTSWNEVKAFCKLVDREWWHTRIGGGLSTGEGLIHAVRDPIVEQVAIKEKSRVVDTQEQITDPGVKDKRLLCVEGELGQALQCAGRDGNTLSPIIRLAWDGAMLRVMTRGAKGECAEPHISIIGHITNTELQTLLTTNDAANGFANRFLWVGVARSQCLPLGGSLDLLRVEELAARTRAAVGLAREIGAVGWAPDARDEWIRVYPALSEGRHGLLGSVTARAEAHTVRLASLYAVLDGKAEIALVHLRAALELWRYAADSAAFIFGDSLGDPLCDAIRGLLRSQAGGATRTEISEYFDRNKTKEQLDAALATLQARGMIRSSQKVTGGRSAEVWQLVSL
jgi:Bifunctional DNA primase/polymerase, N-terminal/Primase C terminal 1 (PriCT-1)